MTLRTCALLMLLAAGLLASPSSATQTAEDGYYLNMAGLLREQEKKVPGIVKGAEARFHFPFPSRPLARTGRSLVYLHGFSASPVEAYPLTENLSSRWNANAYFARYAGHGLQGADGMKAASAQTWANETKLALLMGRQLGKKVVVLASSTGASLLLPALLKDSSNIEAAVLMSPNFGLKAASSELLLAPYPFAWLLGAIAMGPYREFEPINPRQALWWTYRYPFTAVLEMMRAMDAARKARLEDLHVPVLVLYSERDNVVSLEKMREAFARIGSEKKKMVEITRAENDHVLAGVTLSPSGTAEVEAAIEEFLRN